MNEEFYYIAEAGSIEKRLRINCRFDDILYSECNMYKTRELAKKEGLLVGISAGANVWASRFVAQKEEYKNKKIVTILCDTGERYISTELFE